jgi:phage terminase large subunit GpA-like protein
LSEGPTLYRGAFSSFRRFSALRICRRRKARVTDSATWNEFDELLRSHWKHPFGGDLKVDAAVVDAGDGEMDQAAKASAQSGEQRAKQAVRNTALECSCGA